MLQIALAGLVINKVMSLEEAEFVNEWLKRQSVPTTVKGVLDEIAEIRKKYNKK